MAGMHWQNELQLARVKGKGAFPGAGVGCSCGAADALQQLRTDGATIHATNSGTITARSIPSVNLLNLLLCTKGERAAI
jgi:hypothetical protein